MKRFSCNKAQSLSEMAIFGGVLLLVLSYFVSLGIKLTYQQDVQMRAFRMALSESSNEVNRPDAESTVMIVEDKLAPDSRNMVGKGDLITVMGQGNVVWGNQMNGPIIDPAKGVTQQRYLINGEEREYNLGLVTEIQNNIDHDKMWVLLSDQVTRKQIQWGGAGNELRCYKPDASSVKQARILLNPAETDPYKMQTEIITIISRTEDGQLWPIVDLPENLNNGDPVTILNVIMPENGIINPNYMNLDYVKEKAIEPTTEPFFGSQMYLQGFLFGHSTAATRRKEYLKVEETPAGPVISTTEYDATGTSVTHYIRRNSSVYPLLGFPETFTYSPPVKAQKLGTVWTSTK